MKCRWSLLLPALVVAGCVPAHAPVAVPSPEPVAAGAPRYSAPDTVWTGAPEQSLRRDAAPYVLRRPFTRLEVLEADSADLLVQCTVCGEPVIGWIGRHEVVYQATTPDSAAVRSIAEFALAVRRAAIEQDPVALDRVLAHDFTFSSIGGFGRDLVLASWRSENYRTLSRVPALLDSGLSQLGEFWVAPPGFAESFGYGAFRLGFARTPAGRWEWVFAVAGELER
jgi:hypothetical protein